MISPVCIFLRATSFTTLPQRERNLYKHGLGSEVIEIPVCIAWLNILVRFRSDIKTGMQFSSKEKTF